MSKLDSVKKLVLAPKIFVDNLVNRKLSQQISMSRSKEHYNYHTKDFTLFRTLLRTLLSDPQMKALVLEEISAQTGTAEKPILINNLYKYKTDALENKSRVISRKVVCTHKTINSSIEVSEHLRKSNVNSSQRNSLTKYSPFKANIKPVKVRLTKQQIQKCFSLGILSIIYRPVK
jgi:hypothetical protein